MEEVASLVNPSTVLKLSSLINSEARLLSGATTDLKKLESMLEAIKSVLKDAEGKQFRDGSVRQWLENLKQIMYDIEDLVDDCQLKAMVMCQGGRRWSYASSPWAFINKVRFRHGMGVRVGKLNARLKEIHEKRLQLQLTPSSPGGVVATRSFSNRETSSSILDFDIVGMDEDVNQLVEWLVEEENMARTCPTVDVITGMGGIGKTTLAQMVFNHDKIQAHFDVKAWVCVSKNYFEVNLLKQIVREVGGDYGRAKTKSELERKLTEAIGDKRFLLVLDDVWDMTVWDGVLRTPLLNTTSSGSKILVTTRNEQIAREMGASHHHQMKFMSDENCWSMLCKFVFRDKTTSEERKASLKSTGMKIIRKCGGLPLAVRAIGGVLRPKLRNKEEWEKILENHIWNTKDLPEDVHQSLLLSYMDLPSPLKPCFIFCSLFPEDLEISLRYIKQAWIAEGFIEPRGNVEWEDIAAEYYYELVDRGLFRNVREDYFKMHDLVRSLTCFLGQKDYHSLSKDEQLVKDKDLQFRRHLSLTLAAASVRIPDTVKKLRTLMGFKMANFFPTTWPFRGNSIEVDGIVVKLVYLRVLDLSGTGLRKLPKSISSLRNLQFLNVSNTGLEKLPKSIGLLTKLRCLSVSRNSLRYVPRELKKLINLRELHGFVVCQKKGPKILECSKECCCTINELKYLVELRYLSIERQFGSRITTTCATDVGLRKNTNLRVLSLKCDHAYGSDQDREDCLNENDRIVEQLHPPKCLEELDMGAVCGSKLPSWMCGSALDLPKLRQLNLGKYEYAKNLPTLGTLPQLRKLRALMPSLISIGLEFFGDEGKFPKVEEITFSCMSMWQCWQEWGNGAFPCLRSLTLFECPELQHLPLSLQYVTNLTELEIYRAHSIEVIENIPSVQKLTVYDMCCLRRISNLYNLENLDITTCYTLENVENVSILKHLVLKDDTMHDLPNWIEHLESIQSLSITGSKDLIQKCLEGGEDWSKIKHIPHISYQSK